MTLPGDAAPGPGDEVALQWFAARAHAEAEAEAERDAQLASDTERERVCEQLNGAYGEGRLTSTELDERTSAALAARTHGELEDVLAGLAVARSPVLLRPGAERGLLARVMFWVVGFFTFPFVFIATMLMIFGTGVGARVVAFVMLVMFLPGLIALYRWAHPRS